MVVENIQYQQLSIESIHPIRCLLYRFFKHIAVFNLSDSGHTGMTAGIILVTKF